jgi:hypothetical protein
MNDFVRKLNEKNLCTWYILPLIDLNAKAFGSANFVDTFLIGGKMQIAVHVADANLCRDMVRDANYNNTVMIEEKELLVFNIPVAWVEDYNRFVSGKYSKMTDDAKNKIREGSGLKFEVPDTQGNKITDAILMALEQHPVLRGKWFDILGDKTDIPRESELLSIPRPGSFIHIDY